MTLRLAMRMLRREWHSGELGVLGIAIIVAVSSITTVGFFTDRVARGMERGASELLAADLAIHSSRPFAGRYAQAAVERQLTTSRMMKFRSVLLVDGKFQLSEVKAVEIGYPLRGVLQISDQPYQPGRVTRAIPEPGSTWLDPRLATQFGLKPGDQLRLGHTTLRVTQILSFEPDRGGDMFNIAPRLLINLADVPATGLVQPGSRVQYHLLVAGEDAAVASFRQWLEPELDAGQHMHGVRDARPEFRAALERAERFLGLSALVSVLLSGVAIAMAARRFAERHLNSAAVFRCLGAQQLDITAMFCLQVLALGFIASALGCGVGFIAQSALGALLGSLVLGELPPPSWIPAVVGLFIGVVTVVGFALPPLVRLKNVPPARVLRRDLGSVPMRTQGGYLIAALTFAGLLLWQAKEIKLAVYVILGGVATVLVLALLAWLLTRLVGRLRNHVGVAWRFGLANISRHSSASTVQIVAIGLGLTMLLLLGLIRDDLLSTWQNTLPSNTPNYFLVNVQAQEITVLTDFLNDQGIVTEGVFPMIRGRLVSINERPVTADDFPQARAKRLAMRHFNLSWAAELQADNRVTAGRWQSPAPSPGEFSVEQGLAKTLGISLGDSLRFQVGERQVDATVTSLRSVEWDSFRANFFVLASPGLLETFPATYITSFFVPEERAALLATLANQFPSITILDLDAMLTKVRGLMDQATLGIECVFGFTLLAGVVVLLAAVQTTLDERRYETAIVRTLGASRARLNAAILAEFCTMGLLAGMVAAFSASLVGAVIGYQVFDMVYQPNAWVWIWGAMAGTVGIGAVGFLGTRSVLDSPPLVTLRRL